MQWKTDALVAVTHLALARSQNSGASWGFVPLMAFFICKNVI